MVLERHDETADGAAPLRLECPLIETPRLLLRPPHDSDIDDIAALANNYKIARMLSAMPHPYFAADARDFLEKLKTGAGRGCVYAITLKANGAFIGTCGLHEDLARYPLPFLGYWLGETYWGKGFASEASRALVGLFFKVTGRDAMMISCRRENAASRKIILKCGGVFWKTGDAYNKAFGEMHHLEHYRVTRQGWMAVAQR